MIDIRIDYTDHVWPWRYELSSDTINVKKYWDINWGRYAETAEEAFRLAWEAREQIQIRFWLENQLEIEF